MCLTQDVCLNTSRPNSLAMAQPDTNWTKKMTLVFFNAGFLIDLLISLLFRNGGEGARTPDLLDAIETLSQLSYTPGIES